MTSLEILAASVFETSCKKQREKRGYPATAVAVGVGNQCVAYVCVNADQSEAASNHVDSDVEIPPDTVRQMIRKMELVRCLEFFEVF